MSRLLGFLAGVFCLLFLNERWRAGEFFKAFAAEVERHDETRKELHKEWSERVRHEATVSALTDLHAEEPL